MKLVEAVITPWTLEEFKEAAPELGIPEFNIVEVQRSGCATVTSQKRLYRGREYMVDLLPRLKLEFVLCDNDVRSTLRKLVDLVHPDSIAVFKLDEIFHSAESDLANESSLGRAAKRSSGAALRQIGGSGPRRSSKDSARSSVAPFESIAAVKIGNTG